MMTKLNKVYVVTMGNVLQGAFTRKKTAERLKTRLSGYTNPGGANAPARIVTEYWTNAEMDRVSRA